MRRIVNTLLIAVGLALAFFLSTTGDVNFNKITGFVFFDTEDIPSRCIRLDLEYLWVATFRGTYIPGQSGYLIPGSGDNSCVDAVLFKNTFYNAPEREIRYLEVDNVTTNLDITTGYYKLNDPDEDLISWPITRDALFAILNNDDNLVDRDSAIANSAEASAEANLTFWFSTIAGDFTEYTDFYLYEDTEEINGYRLNEQIKIFKETEKAIYLFSSEVFLDIDITFTGTISDFETEEDVDIDDAFDLSDYFTSNVEISYVFNQDSEGVVFSVDGDDVTIEPIGNWNGDISANITAEYMGVVYATSNNYYINITAVNDVPVLVLNIPNVTIEVDGNASIDLDYYYREVDGDDLTYDVDAVTNINITIDSSTGKVYFFPDGGFGGVRSTYFYAEDSEGNKTKSNKVFLIVGNESSQGVNIAPVITTKTPAGSSSTLEVGGSKSFRITATDANGDILSYNWSLDDTDIGVSSSGYTYSAGEEGTFNLKVSVSDGYFTKSESWVILVLAESDGDSSSNEYESQVTEDSGDTLLLVVLIVVALIFMVVGIALIFRLLGKKEESALGWLK